MKSAPDWSIGQRLGTGFGLVALVFAAFTAAVLTFQRQAEDAQSAILKNIIPRIESAREVESALLRVAIAVRALVLEPSAERQDAALARIDETRAALAAAASHPREPDGEEIFRALRPAVLHYLDQAAAHASAAAIQSRSLGETVLARSREAAVGHLRAFSALQAMKTRRALEAVEAAREQVAASLYASLAVLATLLAALGVLVTRSIRTPARELVRVASELQSGNWGPALAFAPAAATARGIPRAPRDELARIALAFGAAAAALEKREQRLQADARLAASISSSLDRREVAERALHVIADAVGAAAGALYWRDAEGSLEPVAAAAMPSPPAQLKAGEGLPGRAAQEGRVVVLTDIPPDTPMQLRLGIDEAPPRAVVAVPAMARGEVFGVAVLASVRAFDAAALEFLHAAGLQLGIGLSNVRSHEEVQRLLADLREAHEQVQAQNEELQAQNEEIQAQSEELQAQNEEIQAQSEELQAQSEELQAQNEELMRGTTELALADARKNQFLGLLAHELRNPLAAIAGSLHLLARGNRATAAEATGIAVIERQMGHLTRLIDDLLDVTRIAHGKLQLQRETFDFAALARDGVNDARATASAAEIDLRLEAPERPVHVDGDRTRLAQVFANLASNAVKFSERGGRVDVSVSTQGDSVSLRVRDTGIGIEPELRARLFEPFSQGDTSIARTKGGLGLGLALSKALVELHGGSIEARSAGRDAGSEFIVTLPVVAAQPERPARPRARNSAPCRRILVVEDNPDAAETLRLALELEGHEVQVASSGLEAVEKASQSVPEIVLCDLGIPGIDGFEVARRMRASSRLAGIPVVALSGYASAEDRARSAEAGFTHHLGKPVRIESLLDLIAGIDAPVRSGAARAPIKASS